MNLNTVPGRKQSILALLYSDWLIALSVFDIQLIMAVLKTLIQFAVKKTKR